MIAYWLEAIAAGDPIQVLGREDVARDYVYIDDIAAALVSAHTVVTPPAVVNIGSGVPTTLHELVVTPVSSSGVMRRSGPGVG